MYRLIKKILKKIWRFLKRGSRSTRRNWLLIYILGLFPSNYITTALTTSSNIANPGQIVQVMKNTNALSSVSGLLNTATGGLFSPITNGVANIAGHVTESIGKTFNIESLTETGSKWVDHSKQWFEAGLNLGSSKSDGDQSDVSNASSVDDYNIEMLKDWKYGPVNASEYYQSYGLATDQQGINDAQEMFQRSDENGLFEYGEGDELGRTTTATAVVTWKSIEKSAGTREKFEKGSNPSGWPAKNPKIEISLPNGKKYHGFAWNRSHLIADSLGGRAFRWNVITGTRMQNVGSNDQKGGMQYVEKEVIEHLRFNQDDKVFYRAIPHYVGNELIPRVVEVQVLAESGRLNERVYTYNILPEYKINYMNAELTKE